MTAPRSEQDWATIISKCKKSNLTTREWCKKHNIGTSVYYKWHARLKSTSQVVEATAFAEVSLKDEVLAVEQKFKPAIIIKYKDLTLEINETINQLSLENILRALHNLC